MLQGFQIFFLPQTTQEIVLILEFIKKVLILFCHSFHILGQNKLVSFNKLLPFNIKSISPIQKYPHIIELYAYTEKIFVAIFLSPIKFLISFEICSTPKLL